MNSELLSKAFEKFDTDYSQKQQERLEKSKHNKDKVNVNNVDKTVDTVKETKTCSGNGENDQIKVEEKKPSYFEKKTMNQYNSLLHNEKTRLSRMRTKKVHIDQLQMVDNKSISEIMSQEMENNCKKKSWKTMDMCFKWNVVNEYLDRQSSDGINIDEEDISNIKKAIQNKTLNVVYDKPTQKILSLKFVTKDNVTI